VKKSKDIKKITGFKVPDAYFDSKTIDFTQIKSVEDQSGFKVPKGYFDNFKIDLSKEVKTIRLYNYKTIAIAASLAILLATLLINLIGSQTNSDAMDFSKLDKQHLFDYIEDEMLLDHDMYINGTDEKPEIFKNDISEEDVLDYLDDTSIEQLMDY
jgi:hypothetical protein